ncbi:hypothetical protein [Pleomorphomonas oryzae]|uniref:hypothetical protein n=1 Tax=Pleomorphomonas oryzae TaxID=261934 RepID=UPI000409E710|nr:hypothetical protein [Pleomorphomonas oryzae]
MDMVKINSRVFVLYGIFVLCILVQGVVSYYSGMSNVMYIAYIAVYVIVFFDLMSILFTRRSDLKGFGRSFIVYLCLLAVSLVISLNYNAISALNGLRVYAFLPVVSMYIYRVLGGNEERMADAVLRLFLYLPVIELVFCAHQHFVVAPMRGGFASWDAVVGTFGGDPNGGGASGALLFYLLISFSAAFWLFATKKVSWGKFIICILSSFGCVALAEVKAIFIFLPILFIFLAAQSPAKSYLRVVLLLVFGMVMLVGVGVSYQEMYYSDKFSGTIESTIDDSVRYVTDIDKVNYETGEVGRAASINIWAGDPDVTWERRILGFGVGSSRVTNTGRGFIYEKYYPLRVAASSINQLLWDIGVVGTIVWFVMFILVLSKGYSREEHRGDERGDLFNISRVVVFLSILYAVYDRSVIEEISVQLIIAFSFAFIMRTHYGNRSYRAVGVSSGSLDLADRNSLCAVSTNRSRGGIF